MKKVLITGGAGFIGYHLAKRLKKNYEIDIVDNFSRAVKDIHLKNLVNNRVNLINIDLTKDNFNKIKNNNYHYVYHLAAIVGVSHVINNPYNVLEKNFSLLKNIIDISTRQKHLKRFIFFSTSEVYASSLKHFGIKFPTKESTYLCADKLEDPRNSYALSKIYGEALCHNSGIPFTILRPHNFYGPRMGMSHVIPELVKKIYFCKENSMQIYNGKHSRTFLYIDDAIKIIDNLIKSNYSKNETFNIGDQKNEINIMNLAKLISKLLNKKLKLIAVTDKNNSPVRRCPSMEKVYKIIKKDKLTSIEEGVKLCFDWYNKYVFNSDMPSSK